METPFPRYRRFRTLIAPGAAVVLLTASVGFVHGASPDAPPGIADQHLSAQTLRGIVEYLVSEDGITRITRITDEAEDTIHA
jgi:hypothetical protein